jgi:hypothetical protein
MVAWIFPRSPGLGLGIEETVDISRSSRFGKTGKGLTGVGCRPTSELQKMNPSDILTKERMITALESLNKRLAEKGVTGELCIYGGAAMVLAFDARESTRDVDAVFVPKAVIYEEASKIAQELNLPDSWLNDGVKGFVSADEDVTTDDMPQWKNLRIFRPATRYLLAMKCMAARVAEYDTVGDKNDIIHLCKDLGIDSSSDVFAILEQYYPTSRIPIKSKYFIEEIIEEMNGGDQ